MGRALIISHTGAATGFGRIAAHVAAALAGEHDVHAYGIGADPAGRWVEHAAHPLDTSRMRSAIDAADAARPDLALLIGAAPFCAWLLGELTTRSRAKTLAYVPLEGLTRGHASVAGLRRADRLLGYHTPGAEGLRALVGDPGPPVASIPHPTLIAAAPLLTGRALRDARAALFPDHEARACGTWILNANRNDQRKDLTATLHAFAAVARDHRDATLVLHGDAWTREGGSLAEYAQTLGVRDRVLFTRQAAAGAWDDERMRSLYRCCELGISTARGEAWGMTAFEHAACGAAQILPEHRSLRAIWDDAPQWLELDADMPLDEITTGRTVDVAHAAAALGQLVRDPARRALASAACQRHATRPELHPAQVAARWRDAVNALCAAG